MMSLPLSEPILEPLLRKLRFNKTLSHIRPNSVVVDIGCGHTPHLLNRLERYIKEGIGVDQLIADRTYGNIKLISKLLADKIPLRGGLADHVTLVAVLEHLEMPGPLLGESYRILKKGGTLILTTPTPLNKPLLEFLSFRLGLVSKREIAEHKTYFWKRELCQLVKVAGFRNIKHQYFELYLNNFLVAKK